MNKGKILLFLTRNPYGRATGRKMVLQTVIQSLRKLGNDLTLVVFDTDETGLEAMNNVILVNPPGFGGVAIKAMYYFVSGHRSMNEAIYHSNSLIRKFAQLAKKGHYDAVYADMIRTAPYASATQLPWILDMDDLLSKRYRKFLTSSDSSMEMFLGYYKKFVPLIFKPLIKSFAKVLASREASLLEKSEIRWAKAASAISLVSPLEAESLATTLKRQVFSLPMAISPSTKDSWTFNKRLSKQEAVFVGGMDYQPNLDAIRFYTQEIEPLLSDHGLDTLRLKVVGYCPESVRIEFMETSVEFLGYVDSVPEIICQFPLFIAPIVSGSGIKTKILEAMAAGVPVIATEMGVSGLGIEHRKECLVARAPAEFPALIKEIMSDGELATLLSRNGRIYVEQNFSPDILKSKWQKVLSLLLS